MLSAKMYRPEVIRFLKAQPPTLKLFTWYVGPVGDPQLVNVGCHERPIFQLRIRAMAYVALRDNAKAAAPAHTTHLFLTHY